MKTNDPLLFKSSRHFGGCESTMFYLTDKTKKLIIIVVSTKCHKLSGGLRSADSGGPSKIMRFISLNQFAVCLGSLSYWKNHLYGISCENIST